MLRALLGFGLVAAPAEACAGAWIAAEDGQAIVTAALAERDDLIAYEGAAYLEAPLNDTLAIVAAPWVEFAPETAEGWRGEAIIGLKRVLFRDDAAVMALQASAYWQSDAPAACGEGGFEGRWLGGLSLAQSGFLNVEVAGRVLEGGCARWRLDLTAGYRPSDNWLAMAQVFYDAPDEGEATLKGQLVVAHFTAAGRGFQLGLRMRLDGADPEPALVLGYWARSIY